MRSKLHPDLEMAILSIQLHTRTAYTHTHRWASHSEWTIFTVQQSFYYCQSGHLDYSVCYSSTVWCLSPMFLMGYLLSCSILTPVSLACINDCCVLLHRTKKSALFLFCCCFSFWWMESYEIGHNAEVNYPSCAFLGWTRELCVSFDQNVKSIFNQIEYSFHQ